MKNDSLVFLDREISISNGDIWKLMCTINLRLQIII